MLYSHHRIVKINEGKSINNLINLRIRKAREEGLMTAEAVKPEAAKEEPKPQATQTKPAQEKQTNCLACNKPIKKLKRYYRDGKFYCNKKCWRKSMLKSKEEKA